MRCKNSQFLARVQAKGRRQQMQLLAAARGEQHRPNKK